MDISKYRADSAIIDYTKAIELDPDYRYTYSYRGDAYVANGNYDLAVIDYTEAIQLNSDSSWGSSLYIDRGQAYLQAGLYDEAIADFSQAIEHSTRPSSTYLGYRALAYLHQKNYALAIDDSNAAIGIYAENDDAFWTRGRAYLALGENEKALTDFKECIRLTEDFEEKYFSETRERNKLIRQEIEKLR